MAVRVRLLIETRITFRSYGRVRDVTPRRGRQIASPNDPATANAGSASSPTRFPAHIPQPTTGATGFGVSRTANSSTSP